MLPHGPQIDPAGPDVEGLPGVAANRSRRPSLAVDRTRSAVYKPAARPTGRDPSTPCRTVAPPRNVCARPNARPRSIGRGPVASALSCARWKRLSRAVTATPPRPRSEPPSQNSFAARTRACSTATRRGARYRVCRSRSARWGREHRRRRIGSDMASGRPRAADLIQLPTRRIGASGRRRRADGRSHPYLVARSSRSHERAANFFPCSSFALVATIGAFALLSSVGREDCRINQCKYSSKISAYGVFASRGGGDVYSLTERKNARIEKERK